MIKNRTIKNLSITNEETIVTITIIKTIITTLIMTVIITITMIIKIFNRIKT